MRKKYKGDGLALTLLALCLLATLTLIIAACTTVGSTDKPNTVHMNTSNFEQPSITIKKGQSITLVDDDSTAYHEIENGTWDSTHTAKPNKEPGAPTVDMQINGDSKTTDAFTTAGTFHFYCTVHTDMNLTVIVK